MTVKQRFCPLRSKGVIFLDDAISVIFSLARTTTKRGQIQTVAKAEIESAVNNQVVL